MNLDYNNLKLQDFNTDDLENTYDILKFVDDFFGVLIDKQLFSKDKLKTVTHYYTINSCLLKKYEFNLNLLKRKEVK